MFKFIQTAGRGPSRFIPQNAFAVEYDDEIGDDNVRVNVAMIDYRFLLPQGRGVGFVQTLKDITEIGDASLGTDRDKVKSYRVGLSKIQKALQENGVLEHVSVSSPIYRNGDPADNFLIERIRIGDAPVLTNAQYDALADDDGISNRELPHIEEERFFIGWLNDRSNKNAPAYAPSKTLVFGTQMMVKNNGMASSKYNDFNLFAEAAQQTVLVNRVKERHGAYTSFDAMEGPEGLYNAMQIASMVHEDERMPDRDDTAFILSSVKEWRRATRTSLDPRSRLRF